MADEQPPPMWRLRETRQLMDWMESRGSHLTDISSIREWLHSQGPGPWWEQLGEVVEALSLEVGEAEIPVKHFVEWLVEWGREIRRRQTGLLLLTAHRAKGLEFDHVVVLDGGWEKIGKGEDRDASRRLYYVAMSRAKQTLSLLRSSRAHPFLDALDTGSEPFVERAVLEGLDHDQTGLDRRYLRLTLKDVDIGFAGRFSCAHYRPRGYRRRETGRCTSVAGEWQSLGAVGWAGKACRATGQVIRAAQRYVIGEHTRDRRYSPISGGQLGRVPVLGQVRSMGGGFARVGLWLLI